MYAAILGQLAKALEAKEVPENKKK